MKKEGILSISLENKSNKSLIINKKIGENYIIAPTITKNGSLKNSSNRQNNKSKVRLSFYISSEIRKNVKKNQDYKNWSADKFILKKNNKTSLYNNYIKQIDYFIEDRSDNFSFD